VDVVHVRHLGRQSRGLAVPTEATRPSWGSLSGVVLSLNQAVPGTLSTSPDP
jgi:hypothetical protein